MTTATETTRHHSVELEGDWAVFDKIAGYFLYKVRPEDREDFHHDLLVAMAKVKEKYDAQGKPLTEAGLMWVARYEVMAYWARRMYRLFGLNCSNCTIQQRSECRSWPEPSRCPKGKRRPVLSLNKIMRNGDGHKPTELQDLIADKAIDINAKLDARRILQGLPKTLVKVGYKVYAGIPLKKEEKRYLKHWQDEHWEKEHPASFNWGRDHLDERILELLRENPKGLTRSGLSKHLLVFVREVNWYLDQLLKDQQVIAVRRERITRGRQWTPLFFIAGADIPEQKNIVAERDERIRQAYFTEGWSIRRIIRELHHDKRIIRRAIDGI